ncbi:MAG: cation diffusion facilitator family transporter [Pseudomonadota bacterium]
MSQSPCLAHFAWLSICAAIATIALKTFAYLLTGSVGLLSDALESIVNLIGAVLTLVMLKIAALPADDNHAYGHTKAEYFSSGVEGGLIIIAAGSIALAATQRLIHPVPLEKIGLGLAVSFIASLINLVVALVLIKAGKKFHSVSLQSNAHHLLTDVWTSAGVLVGVGAVSVTGWNRLDPLVALFVAANIVWTGFKIIKNSVLGLMDTALPPEDRETIRNIMEDYRKSGIEYHALRTRQSGSRKFVSFHVLTPAEWTVLQGHQLLEEIEDRIRQALPNVSVFTHLEPLTDPAAWDDIHSDNQCHLKSSNPSEKSIKE